MKHVPDSVLVLAILVVLFLGYAFAGMATAKAIVPRFGASDHPDHPELCGMIWPIYWTYRGLDWATSWAEPSDAAQGPKK